MPIRWHDDDSALLQDAILFTASETGFIPRLVEKDYFCSVLLEYLSENHDALIFKGGTCLSKIHAGFYRLSEDLDFSISTPRESSRADRRKNSSKLKGVISDIPGRLPVFRIVEGLRGANNSTQYNATIGYDSLLASHVEPISIEVGLREPHLTEPHLGSSRTALLNPITGRSLVAAHPVRALSYPEAMAEKLRAALCRREVAIRDFFDVDHAVRKLSLNTNDPALLELLRKKLAVPGTGEVNVSSERLDLLRRQPEAQLRPVLLARDYERFDLERAFNIVHDVATRLE